MKEQKRDRKVDKCNESSRQEGDHLLDYHTDGQNNENNGQQHKKENFSCVHSSGVHEDKRKQSLSRHERRRGKKQGHHRYEHVGSDRHPDRTHHTVINLMKSTKDRSRRTRDRNNEAVNILTEDELVASFSYSPQSEIERQVLESAVPPMGGNRMDNACTILLGKWAITHLNGSSSNNTTIVRALTEFISDFSFFHADCGGKDIYAFQRILTDAVTVKGELVSTVLTALVDQLRSFRQTMYETQNTVNKVDSPPPGLVIGRFEFPSKSEARKRFRTILQSSVEDVNLEGDDLALVTEVLKRHPRTEAKMKFMTGVYVGIHPTAKSRSFMIRKEPGTIADEDFSYIRCLENISESHDTVYERICQTLLQIVKIFPRSYGELTELLSSRFPRLKSDIDDQLTFLKSCLWFARYLTPIRHSILRIVLQKLLAIDVEIKMADPNYIDVAQFEAWKETQLKLLAIEIEKGNISVNTATQILSQPEWFEETYKKVRSEEDIDDMANKLDMLMTYLFVWTDQELSEKRYVKAPLHMIAIAKALVSDDNGSGSATQSCSAASDSQLSETRNTLKVSSPEPDQTMADIIVTEILGIFKCLILPAHRCRCVQFYVFYVVSLKIEWAEKFLQILFTLLFNPDGVITARRMCAAYIASFVCRAAYLPVKFCRTALMYLLQFLHEFYTLWSQQAVKEGDAEARAAHKLAAQKLQRKTHLKPDSRLTLFYSVCQAACYIVCYHGDILKWGELRLEKPLENVGKPPVNHLSFLIEGEKNLVSILSSDLVPLVQCKRGIVEEFISTCRRLGGFEALESRFRQFESQFTANEGAELWKFDPFESVFPFDPYQLRQSNRYIRPLYRTWYSVEKLKNVAKHLEAQHSNPAVATVMGDEKNLGSSRIYLETAAGMSPKSFQTSEKAVSNTFLKEYSSNPDGQGHSPNPESKMESTLITTFNSSMRQHYQGQINLQEEISNGTSAHPYETSRMEDVQSSTCEDINDQILTIAQELRQSKANESGSLDSDRTSPASPQPKLLKQMEVEALNVQHCSLVNLSEKLRNGTTRQSECGQKMSSLEIFNSTKNLGNIESQLLVAHQHSVANLSIDGVRCNEVGCSQSSKAQHQTNDDPFRDQVLKKQIPLRKSYINKEKLHPSVIDGSSIVPRYPMPRASSEKELIVSTPSIQTVEMKKNPITNDTNKRTAFIFVADQKVSLEDQRSDVSHVETIFLEAVQAAEDEINSDENSKFGESVVDLAGNNAVPQDTLTLLLPTSSKCHPPEVTFDFPLGEYNGPSLSPTEESKVLSTGEVYQGSHPVSIVIETSPILSSTLKENEDCCVNDDISSAVCMHETIPVNLPHSPSFSHLNSNYINLPLDVESRIDMKPIIKEKQFSIGGVSLDGRHEVESVTEMQDVTSWPSLMEDSQLRGRCPEKAYKHNSSSTESLAFPSAVCIETNSMLTHPMSSKNESLNGLINDSEEFHQTNSMLTHPMSSKNESLNGLINDSEEFHQTNSMLTHPMSSKNESLNGLINNSEEFHQDLVETQLLQLSPPWAPPIMPSQVETQPLSEHAIATDKTWRNVFSLNSPSSCNRTTTAPETVTSYSSTIDNEQVTRRNVAEKNHMEGIPFIKSSNFGHIVDDRNTVTRCDWTLERKEDIVNPALNGSVIKQPNVVVGDEKENASQVNVNASLCCFPKSCGASDIIPGFSTSQRYIFQSNISHFLSSDETPNSCKATSSTPIMLPLPTPSKSGRCLTQYVAETPRPRSFSDSNVVSFGFGSEGCCSISTPMSPLKGGALLQRERQGAKQRQPALSKTKLVLNAQSVPCTTLSVAQKVAITLENLTSKKNNDASIIRPDDSSKIPNALFPTGSTSFKTVMTSSLQPLGSYKSWGKASDVLSVTERSDRKRTKNYMKEDVKVYEGHSCSESTFDIYRNYQLRSTVSPLSIYRRGSFTQVEPITPITPEQKDTSISDINTSRSINQITPILDLQDDDDNAVKTLHQRKPKSESQATVGVSLRRIQSPGAVYCSASSDGETSDGYENRTLGFYPSAISIREDQVVEELKDVEEWENYSPLKTPNRQRPNKYTPPLSRLSELINSRAYRASLAPRPSHVQLSKPANLRRSLHSSKSLIKWKNDSKQDTITSQCSIQKFSRNRKEEIQHLRGKPLSFVEAQKPQRKRQQDLEAHDGINHVSGSLIENSTSAPLIINVNRRENDNNAVFSRSIDVCCPTRVGLSPALPPAASQSCTSVPQSFPVLSSEPHLFKPFSSPDVTEVDVEADIKETQWLLEQLSRLDQVEKERQAFARNENQGRKCKRNYCSNDSSEVVTDQLTTPPGFNSLTRSLDSTILDPLVIPEASTSTNFRSAEQHEQRKCSRRSKKRSKVSKNISYIAHEDEAPTERLMSKSSEQSEQDSHLSKKRKNSRLSFKQSEQGELGSRSSKKKRLKTSSVKKIASSSFVSDQL